MKANKIIDILNKAINILNLYGEEPLDKALESIYNDLMSVRENKNCAVAVPLEVNQSADTKLIEIAEKLNSMTKEEIITILQKYNKNDLVSIGSIVGLKVKMSLRKNEMINIIAEHFNFRLLNEKIAGRQLISQS